MVIQNKSLKIIRVSLKRLFTIRSSINSLEEKKERTNYWTLKIKLMFCVKFSFFKINYYGQKIKINSD